MLASTQLRATRLFDPATPGAFLQRKITQTHWRALNRRPLITFFSHTMAF
ncbi:hypothetical protein SynMINOS11_02034 [Synechococcus sp. Minos11]|nr:hypothetical protein SynMINOS11_02034 [Synechococcus sp. Minos11]